MKQPDFGVRERKIESKVIDLAEFEDDVEIRPEVSNLNPASLYSTFANESVPVFDESIGLTIEKLPDGVTLDSLWRFKL